MSKDDIKSIDKMSKLMKGQNKGFRQMQWFHFEKSSPYTLIHKETLNEDLPLLGNTVII